MATNETIQDTVYNGNVVTTDTSTTATLSVSTDQADYAPLSTATITAENVTAGATVEFLVTDTNTADGVTSGTGTVWTATDGGVGDADGTVNGTVVTTWSVAADAANQSFVLSATDTTTGGIATANFTDSVVDVSGQNSSNSTDLNGAIITNTTSVLSTGTGQFNTFLVIQHNNTESGFNTDGSPLPLDDKQQEHTNAIQLSAIPLVNADGTAFDPATDTGPAYREFRLDLNETQSSDGPLITLEQLKIYQGDAGNLLSLPGSPIYDLGDHAVLLSSEWDAGSGKGDYVVLIPDSVFDPDHPYVYLYSKFSGSDGGFEEWGTLGTSSGGGGTPFADISFEKQTQDLGSLATNADDGTPGDGQTILAGEAIQWVYSITNTGNVDLTNVKIVDDMGTADTSDDVTINVGHVAAGATVVETYAGGPVQAVAQVGDYLNTATVSGDSTAGGVSTSDTSNYFGADPEIAITKVTIDGLTDAAGVAAAYATGSDNHNLLVGDDVTWIYQVTNTGNVALSGISVTDNQPGVDPTLLTGDANNNGMLDAGETWYYTAAGVATKGAYTNTGTATGSFTDDAGHTAAPSAHDDSGYFGADAEIAINKVTIDGSTDAAGVAAAFAGGSDSHNILAGEGITWIYQVTNTGNVALSDVSVTDNRSGVSPTLLAGDANNNGLLDTNETWYYTATGTAQTGAYTNTGTASGSYTDDAGHAAAPSAHDDSGYFGADPEIHIVKDTTGSTSVGPDQTLNTSDDGKATGDGISILAGSNVTWTYTVTNTGNVNLSHLVISDDKLGLLYNDGTLTNGVTLTGDTNSDGVLGTTETWTLKATGTAIVGSYVNTGKATGSFADDAGHVGTATDDDGSSYTGTFTEAEAGRTQGFWGSHTEAWDGSVANNSKWAKLVGTDLWSAEVNPNQASHTVQLDPTHSATANAGDVLLGDTDHDGLITGSEVGILVTKAVASSILSSSVGGDHRLIMLQQAIAAQLNIDNHDVNPGDPWSPANTTDKLAGDMITEAVQWLKAYGGSAFSDGVLNATDYNTSTGKFAVALTAAQDTSFWSTSRDVDGTSKDIHATGEDLKNVLMAFNTNKIVTSASDQIGWNTNTSDPQHVVSLTGVQANGPDAFWGLAHDNISNFGLTWHG